MALVQTNLPGQRVSTLGVGGSLPPPQLTGPHIHPTIQNAGINSQAPGATYLADAAGFIDAHPLDALHYLSPAVPSWVLDEGFGTTAQRPASPYHRQRWYDTTLNRTVVFNADANAGPTGWRYLLTNGNFGGAA